MQTSRQRQERLRLQKSRRRLRRRARAARRVAWVQSTSPIEAAPLTQARTRCHGRAGGGVHSSAFTAVRLNPEENASQNSPQSEQVCQESFVYSALTNLRLLCASAVRVGVRGVCVCLGALRVNK